MKRFSPLLLALALGLAGAVLRLVQLSVGFEADTGLAIQGSPIHILVPAFAAAAALLLFAVAFHRKGKELAFCQCFGAPDGLPMYLLIVAAFLFMGGGGLYLMEYLRFFGGLRHLICAFLALLSGAALLLLLRGWRQEGTASGIFLMPAMVFFLIQLLGAYLDHGTFPVLARYGLEILAIAAVLLGFYQTAAACYRQARARTLCWTLCFGVALAPAAIVDLLSLGQSVTLAAGTAVLAAFAAALTSE